jgi:hypothetical protein
MFKILKAEIRYNWYAFVVAAALSVFFSVMVIIFGEDDWRGPTLLQYAAMIISSGGFNVHFGTEKRYLTHARLPQRPGAATAMYFTLFLLIALIVNGTTLLALAIAKPEIISSVLFARLLIIDSAYLGGLGLANLAISFSSTLPIKSKTNRTLAGLPFALLGFVFFLLPNFGFFLGWATSGNYQASKNISYDWQTSVEVAAALFLFSLLVWAINIALAAKRRTYFNK